MSDETLNLIKLAHKTPIHMTPAESIEFAIKPVSHGIPALMPSKGRGPKPKITNYQYSASLRERLFKRLYHRPIALPRAGANARRRTGGQTRSVILSYADRARAKGVKRHNLAKEIVFMLALDRQPAFDESTIRKILRANKWV